MCFGVKNHKIPPIAGQRNADEASLPAPGPQPSEGGGGVIPTTVWQLLKTILDFSL